MEPVRWFGPRARHPRAGSSILPAGSPPQRESPDRSRGSDPGLVLIKVKPARRLRKGPQSWVVMPRFESRSLSYMFRGIRVLPPAATQREELVETKGFEPSTPGLQSRCSTN